MQDVLVGAQVGLAVGILHGGRINGILRPVAAEADRGDCRPLEIIRAVNASLGREDPAVLEGARLIVMAHDFIKGRLRHALQGLGHVGAELVDVEILTGGDSDLRHFPDHRCVRFGGRIVLHQFGQQLEIILRAQGVHLIAHRRLHVNVRVNDARRRRVGLAVRAERNHRDVVLHLMHRVIIFRCAGAIDATQDPDQAGRRFIFGHAVGQRAAPAGAGDGVFLRSGAGGALAGVLKNVGPAIEHGKQVVTVLRIGQAQYPRLLADVQPGDGVERVGIGGRHLLVRGSRIVTQPEELPHRGGLAFGFFHVGLHPPGVFHRDQRVAVDVSLGADRDRFLRRQ